MALLPIMQNDLPLMIGDPLVPAMAEEGDACLCCEETVECSNCTGGTAPATVTVTIAGFVTDSYTVANGTWVIPTSILAECGWVLETQVEGPCDPTDPENDYAALTFNVSVASTTPKSIVVTLLYGVNLDGTAGTTDCYTWVLEFEGETVPCTGSHVLDPYTGDSCNGHDNLFVLNCADVGVSPENPTCTVTF